MKLTLDLDGKHLEVEFASANGRAWLTFGERRYEAEVSEPEPHLFVVMIEGRVFRCAIDRVPGGATEATVNDRRFAFTVRDRKHLRGNAVTAANAGGRVTLIASMPGKVVRVFCAEGDEVAVGQSVLVIEAMKMQNEIQAPKAGRVVNIRVREGQTVNAGEILAIVE
jgi:biotin carboxyl carrier protein